MSSRASLVLQPLGHQGWQEDSAYTCSLRGIPLPIIGACREREKLERSYRRNQSEQLRPLMCKILRNYAHLHMWMCIGGEIGGRSWQRAADGGMALQSQSLKLNLCPLFVCRVFESIQPPCAQYLRNNSGVDSLVSRAQRAAGGAEGLGFSAD